MSQNLTKSDAGSDSTVPSGINQSSGSTHRRSQGARRARHAHSSSRHKADADGRVQAALLPLEQRSNDSSDLRYNEVVQTCLGDDASVSSSQSSSVGSDGNASDSASDSIAELGANRLPNGLIDDGRVHLIEGNTSTTSRVDHVGGGHAHGVQSSADASAGSWCLPRLQRRITSSVLFNRVKRRMKKPWWYLFAFVLLSLSAAAVTTVSFLAPSIDPPVRVRGGALATNDERCSQIGVDVMREGGNAVDAAVAAAFCCAVVDPFGSGLGGGGYALVFANRTADMADRFGFNVSDSGELVQFDARVGFSSSVVDFFDYEVQVGIRGSMTMFDTYVLDAAREEPTSERLRNASRIAHARSPYVLVPPALTVGMPGIMYGLYAMHERYGRAQWSALLQPAIRLARSGFEIGALLDAHIQEHATWMRAVDFPGVVAPDGRLKRLGEYANNFALANTLETLADEPLALYDASHALAAAFLDDVASLSEGDEHTLGEDDLRFYSVNRRAPLSTSYRGRSVLGAPAPSAGGAFTLHALNALENTDYGSLSAGEQHHVMMEAIKSALQSIGATAVDPSRNVTYPSANAPTAPLDYAVVFERDAAHTDDGDVSFCDVGETKCIDGSAAGGDGTSSATDADDDGDKSEAVLTSGRLSAYLKSLLSKEEGVRTRRRWRLDQSRAMLVDAGGGGADFDALNDDDLSRFNVIGHAAPPLRALGPVPRASTHSASIVVMDEERSAVSLFSALTSSHDNAPLAYSAQTGLILNNRLLSFPSVDERMIRLLNDEVESGVDDDAVSTAQTQRRKSSSSSSALPYALRTANNRLEPGRRVPSLGAPTLIVGDGRVQWCLGSSLSVTKRAVANDSTVLDAPLLTGLLQVLEQALEVGVAPRPIVEAPRMHASLFDVAGLSSASRLENSFRETRMRSMSMMADSITTSAVTTTASGEEYTASAVDNDEKLVFRDIARIVLESKAPSAALKERGHTVKELDREGFLSSVHVVSSTLIPFEVQAAADGRSGGAPAGF